jgi:methionyl aminopeptidase
MTIQPKTNQELATMREGGTRLSRILKQTNDFTQVGRTLIEIDAFIADQIKKEDGTASFLGYQGYPASSCLSLNDVVVHGIPNHTKLKQGDILGIDVGFYFDGFHTDAAFTKALGEVNPATKHLLRVTQEALKKGVAAAHAGHMVEAIGMAIEAYVKQQGDYGIIRDLTGHGIGKNLQEAPEIMNYAAPNKTELVNGMTLAIEPMIATGTWQVTIDDDDWTVRTKDRSPCAHFETTIVIVDDQPEVLVQFPLHSIA